VPLVVGGGDANDPIYRGDSFLCAAAVHAGVFPSATGGCAAVQFVGTFTNFQSSSANGVRSIEFPSTFPLAYRFIPAGASYCVDLEWSILAFNVVMSFIFVVVFGGGWGEVRRKESPTLLKNETLEPMEIFPSMSTRNRTKRKWGGPELVYWVLVSLIL
jgi:hypothetical protein